MHSSPLVGAGGKRCDRNFHDFLREIRRFLPAATVRDTVEKETYWAYLIQVIDEHATRAIRALK
jgi:hypothetical protein